MPTPVLTEMTVNGYGGGKRHVGTASRTSHWYKAGEGLVPLRWVFVRDLVGTHRQEYFFTTELTLHASGDHHALRVALEPVMNLCLGGIIGYRHERSTEAVPE